MGNRGTVILLVLCGVAIGCGFADKELFNKQEMTLNDMRLVCNEWRGRKHDMTLAEFKEMVAGELNGVDRWGNEYLVQARSSENEMLSDFLFVSLGSDGKLDVSKPGDYFSTPRSDPLTRGDLSQLDRDIVLINCVTWTVGSGK